MGDVFISYSRRDIAFARILNKALEDNDYETWIDWQDIPPSTEWLAEVYEAIEQADTFVFVISESSIDSEICNLEISHAVKNNKKLVPVVIDETDSHRVTPALAALNWLFFRSKDEFSQAFQDLIDAIHTDYTWVKEHTRLQVRALEWERKDKEKGYLLRGRDLSEAEEWLAQAQDKELEPTSLHQEYIAASRKAATRRKHVAITSTTAAVLIIISAVIVITIIQVRAQKREEESKQVTVSQQLAEESTKQLDDDLPLALLLSLEAMYTKDTIEARSSLLDALNRSVCMEAFLYGQNEQVQCMAFRPDGKLLATGGCLEKEYVGQEQCVRGGIYLWDVENRILLDVLEADLDGNVLSMAFSPDGSLLAVGGSNRREEQGAPVKGSVQGAVEIWDVETRQRVGETLVGHLNESSYSDNQVEELAFSPDGRLLAASGLLLDGDSWRGTVTIWDVEEMKAVGEPLNFGGDISGLSFSLHGDRLIASSQFNNSVALWSITDSGIDTNPVVWEIESPQELACSPSEDILAVSHGENSITLYNLPGGGVVCEPLTAPAGSGGALSFSADGRYLVAAGTGGIRSTDNRFCVWDVTLQDREWDEVAKEYEVFRVAEVAYELQSGTPWAVTRVAFNPAAGYRLATGGLDGSTVLWDLEKRHPLAAASIEGLPAALSVAFDPGGSVLASSHNDGTVKLWGLQALSEMDTLTISESGSLVNSIDIAPDGKTLIAGTCDWGTNVSLWNLEDLEPVGSGVTGHGNECFSVAFSPMGDVAASGSLDGTIIFWNPTTGMPLCDPLTDIPAEEGHSFRSNDVWSIAFMPDGETLVSGRGGGDILMWDVAQQNPQGEAWPAHDSAVMALAISPDGGLLASGGDDRLIKLWDMETLEPIGEPLSGHDDAVFGLAFSPDSTVLASVSWDGTMRLWDVETGRALGHGITVAVGASANGVCFSTDGKILATAATRDGDGCLTLWDMETEKWMEQAQGIANRDLTPEELQHYLGDTP